MLDAIILAAGKGVRLEPITTTRPKVLVPVLGDTLISRHIKHLKALGLKRLIIVVSYLKNKVINYVNALNTNLGMEIEFVDQGKELGTAHAISSALPYIKTKEVLIIYGDLYLGDLVLQDLISKPGNILGVVKVRNPEDYGLVLIGSEGNVKEIIEKPSKNEIRKYPPYVNAGLYKLSSTILKLIDKVELSPRGEYEFTDVIKLAIKNNYVIKSLYISESNWSDVGLPWIILEVNKLELSKLRERVIKGYVEPGVTVKGPVYIDEGVIVKSGTYIEGPVYIGKDSIIGPNAYLRPYSVILNQSKIGASVEVKGSVVMENVHASHLSYIGDSVICECVNLGAGTVTANLRFDEKEVSVYIRGRKVSSGRKKLGAFIGGYVKTGINVSIYPGVKIGAYSWIYPGLTVKKDVPPKTIMKGEDIFEPLKINEEIK